MIVVAAFAGCSSYPANMAKAEWLSLSPAQQKSYLEKEARLLKARETEVAAGQSRTVLNQVLREEETYRGKVRDER